MRKQQIVAAVIALAMFPAVAAAGESSTLIWLSPSSKVAEGAYLIDQGKTERGMELTLEALEEKLMPHDRAAALNNLCTAELSLRRLRDAIGHCTTAISIRGSLWQGYNNRGNAHYLLGNYDEAITDYNRALLIRPDLRVIEYNLTLAIDRKARKAPPIIDERES